MKRVLAVLLLIFALSFPVFAGHTYGGNFACTCDTAGCIEDYPGECSGHGGTQQGATPVDSVTGLGIALAALLFWLRMRA